MSDQPLFRFYPNAYAEDGAFRRSDHTCNICERDAVWLYAGGIYMEGDEPAVCARCMADGSLRRKLPKQSYALQDAMIEGADPALVEEILTATPEVACINTFEWPVIDGMPLAFLGEGDSAPLKSDPAVRAAIREVFDGEDAHGSHALVFRTLDGKTTVAIADLD